MNVRLKFVQGLLRFVDPAPRSALVRTRARKEARGRRMLRIAGRACRGWGIHELCLRVVEVTLFTSHRRAWMSAAVSTGQYRRRL